MSFIQKFLNLTFYTSELDQFLQSLYHKYPKLSASQLAEQEKYDRIFKLRDDSTQHVPEKKFWENF